MKNSFAYKIQPSKELKIIETLFFIVQKTYSNAEKYHGPYLLTCISAIVSNIFETPFVAIKAIGS